MPDILDKWSVGADAPPEPDSPDLLSEWSGDKARPENPEGDAPIDFEGKREVLRRINKSFVSAGGLDLEYKPENEKQRAAYEKAIDIEMSRYQYDGSGTGSLAGLTKSEAAEIITAYPAPDPATFYEKATVVRGDIVSAGMTPVTKGTPWIMGKLFGDEGERFARAITGDVGRSIMSGEHELGPERYSVASQELNSTMKGRLIRGGAGLVGSMAVMKGLKQPVSAVSGRAAATPGILASEALVGGRGVEGAGEAALFGTAAHGAGAVVGRWLSKLPIAKQRVAQEVLGRANGAISFQAAGEMMAGLQGEELFDAENAVHNIIFGAAMAGRLKPAPAKPRAETPQADAVKVQPRLDRGPIIPEPLKEVSRRLAEPGGREFRQSEVDVIEKDLRNLSGAELRAFAGELNLPLGGRRAEVRTRILETIKSGGLPDPTTVSRAVPREHAAERPVPEGKQRARVADPVEPGAVGVGRVTTRVTPEQLAGLSVEPTPPEAARRASGERGAVNVGAVVEPVEAVASKAGRFLSRQGGSIRGELRRMGRAGARVEREIRKARNIEVEEREAVRPEFEAADKVISSKEAREGFKSLAAERMEPGKHYGFSNLEVKSEGVEPMTAAERVSVDPLMDFVYKRGERAELAGVPGFKNKRGRLPRSTVGDFHRVLREGPRKRGKLNTDWDAVERALADRPEIGTREAARKWMLEAQEVLASDGPASMDVKSQFEFTRQIERFPAWVKTSKGRVLQLLETNPSRLLRSLHERGAKRIAFGRTFGWPDASSGGQPRGLLELRRRLLRDGGDVKLFDEAVRSMQGSNIEQPVHFDADAKGAMAVVSSASGLLKTGVLGRAWKAAATEPSGPFVEVVGPVEAVKSSVESVVGAFRERVLGTRSPAVERLRDAGTIPSPRRPVRTRDPSRHVEDVIDRLAEANLEVNMLGPASRVLNQRNFALGVDRWMARLSSGSLNSWNQKTAAGHLRVYGEYSQAQSTRLAAGKGTKAEYAEAVRRMTGNLSGANQSTLAQSRLEHRRWFKQIPFTRFATTQIRTEARYARDILKSLRRGPTETANALYRWSRHIAGRGAQSVLWQALGHLLSGGDMEQFIKRWKTNPGDEALVAITTAMFAGSFGQIAYGWTSEGLSGETSPEAFASTAVRAFWPVAVASDAVNIVKGEGSYEGMDAGEKLTSAAMRWWPQSKDFIAVLDIAKVTSDEHQMSSGLRRARNEFFRNVKYGPGPRGYTKRRSGGEIQTAEEQEATDAFRAAMRRVDRAAKAFAPKDEVVAELHRAMGAKDEKTLRSAILARRMLASGVGASREPLGKLNPEQLKRLKTGLTEENIEILKNYDLRLERIADWAYTPTRTNGRRFRRRRK